MQMLSMENSLFNDIDTTTDENTYEVSVTQIIGSNHRVI